MSRARELAGFATATNPIQDLNVGVVTAISFSGDGSSLTGIDATSIKDGDGTVRAQANTSGVVVTGIITATSLEGDGSALTGLPAGLGTAVSATGDGANVYYTNQVLDLASNLSIDVPATAVVAYTQYPEVAVASGIDLTIADGDDFVADILGIGTTGAPQTLAGGGGRMRADNFTDRGGYNAPTFPNGVSVTGVVTATSSVQVSSGGTFGSNGASAAVYYGDGSSLTGIASIVTGNTSVQTADTGSDGHIKITTEGTERLRIIADGKVGIGTTIPTRSFDVRGDATIGIDQHSGNPGTTVGVLTVRGHHVNSDAEYAQLYLANSNSSGGATASIRANRDATSNFATSLSFFTNHTVSAGNGDERLRIGTTGQLGLSAGGAGVAATDFGTSGQVLTSGGASATATWADAGGGEWTLLASGTPTSGTNETITESHFSSTYWRYKVVFNMNCTTQGLFGFQIKNSSGWITSATYFHHQFYNDGNTETSDYYNNGEFMRPFWFPDGGRQWRGTLHLWNPSASDGEKYWYYENVQALNQTTYDGSSYFWSGGQSVSGSFRSNTSAITGLRMYMEEGITERCGGGTDTAGVSQWVLYGAKSS